jgi:hypothetical protein
MSYKFHRGIAGAEWNWARDLTEDDLLGEGPKSVAYSVRAGVEYVCTPIVTGRLGYAVRWQDGDDLTQANEMVGQSFSLGLALKPVATSWSFEAGYAFGVLGSDYDDPAQPTADAAAAGLEVALGFLIPPSSNLLTFGSPGEKGVDLSPGLPDSRGDRAAGTAKKLRTRFGATHAPLFCGDPPLTAGPLLAPSRPRTSPGLVSPRSVSGTQGSGTS